MEESTQLMEIALTAVIALAVGFTTAASTMTQSNAEMAQVRDLADRVLQAWVPFGAPVVGGLPSKQLEI